MLLRMEHLSGVENVRNYPPEMIQELEQLLLAGASASPDPKRKHFFDLENRDRTFFVYISPVTSQVVLVAIWPRATYAVGVANRAAPGVGCTA